MGTTDSNRPNGRWAAVRHGELTPARVTAIYLLLAFGALYVSDVLLPTLVSSPPLLARLQTLKGIAEVALTAGLILVLTTGSHASLRTANDHLSAARRELNVLHRILRHNLRNDLTVVAGHAEELESELDQPGLADRCEVIRASCDDLLTSAEKAQLVADINRDAPATTSVDLAAALENVVRRVDGVGATADVEWSVPDGATVMAHEYIEFTFQELIENAIEHSDAAEPAVSVTVRERPDSRGWWEIRVEDDGPGIPDAELAGLHQQEKPLSHGSGVGLWVAGWIVHRSGGTFDIENTEQGCRVTVALPTPDAVSCPSAEAVVDRFLA